MLAAGYTAVGRVPLPRRSRGVRRRGGGGGGRDRDRAAPRRLRARRARPHAPAVRRRATWRRWSRCELPGSRSGSPPTPCAPARATGSRRSAATRQREGLPLHIHADEQPREIQECLEEHDCRPIELLADTGCLTPRTTDHPRDARERRGARSPRRHGCAHLRLPDDRGRPRRRLPPRRRRCGSGRSRSASARTRTCGSTRSRSSASSRGSRAARRAGAASSRPTSCSRSARRREPGRSQLDDWAPIAIDVEHRSLAGVAAEHVTAALIAGCAADVVVAGER